MTRKIKPSHGFTLIEILVVVVIIGIIATSAASLVLRDHTAENLKTETQRLISLINLAREEAVLQSKELAIFFERDRYSFYTLFEGEWIPIKQDSLLRPRQLTEGVKMELELEGSDTLLPDPAEVFTLESSIKEKEEETKESDKKGKGKETDKNKKKPKPQVFVLSSSEVSPFILILTAGDDHEIRIKADALGNLDIVDPDKT